ncbi:MAG TPA: glutathione S-transferase N-terminal domain-containing protein [Steroidobacter sp.]|uniref:glutathione S-transferase family protein n=1 Tax=Steroidobacter sp. TaxID=1978227 RepID=UPI002EDA2F15
MDPQTQPIELLYWPTPNGWKVPIALEEMGLPYVLRRVDLYSGEQHRPEFRSVNPHGKIPAIVDPEGPGAAPITVFESAAILQYLGRKTGLLYPADPRTRCAIDQWMIWQAANLGPVSAQLAYFLHVAPKTVENADALSFASRKYAADLATLYTALDRRLSDREYLVDDYSLADIMCWPGVTRYAIHGLRLDDYPYVRAWLERIAARPAVQRGAFAGYEWDPSRRGMSPQAYELLTGRAREESINP